MRWECRLLRSWVIKVTGFLAYEKRYLLKYQSATYPDRLVTLPIPNDEIVTMEGVLVQNENWK